MSCSHTRSRYETTRVYNSWTGEDETETKFITEDTVRDIDTHRYECTQCKRVFYYSSAAKDFYEKGIKRGVFR